MNTLFTIESLKALKQGWDDPTTPPLPIEALEAAEDFQRFLESLELRYRMDPGPGGFVAFDITLISGNVRKTLTVWIYSFNTVEYCRVMTNLYPFEEWSCTTDFQECDYDTLKEEVILDEFPEYVRSR